MKIYTRAGDDGRTGLLGPGRVPKDSARIEAYGSVDELNAAIGMARALGPDPAADAALGRVQEDLFFVGAALADPDPAGRFHGAVAAEPAARLEHEIDAMEASLAPLAQFILPGGTPAGAALHLARTVCRRAERRAVALSSLDGEDVPRAILIYLNRLSDWLFVAARAVNARGGAPERAWRGI